MSAVISDATKERLEVFARTHGIKKSHLIEMAILHHLAALEQLPADVVIPPVIELSRAEGRELLLRIRRPAAPTPALKALFDAD